MKDIIVSKIKDYLGEKRRIRIFSDNMNGLGDFILASWILKTLKERLNVEITVLVWPHCKLFADFLPFIDETIYWDCLYEDEAQYDGFKKRLSVRGPYTIAFDFAKPPRSTGLCLSVRPQILIGFEKVPKDLRKHYDLILNELPDESILRQNKQILDLFGIKEINLENYPVIQTPSDLATLNQFFALNNLRGEDITILIHPGAGRPARQWPLDKFARLADSFIERYQAKAIFTGGQIQDLNPVSMNRGENEEEMVSNILKQMHHPAINIACQTNARLLSQLMRRVSLFIGNDSGPAHLAAALNLPTIVIWGGGSIQPWKPVGKYVEVIHKVSDLKCHPCGSEECKNGRKLCLERIEPEDVIKRFEDKLLPIIKGMGQRKVKKVAVELGRSREAAPNLYHFDTKKTDNVNIIGSLTKLPFKKGSLAYVRNVYLIEHLKDDEVAKVLRGWYTHIEPLGVLYLIISNLGHFDSQYLLGLLKEIGFRNAYEISSKFKDSANLYLYAVK